MKVEVEFQGKKGRLIVQKILSLLSDREAAALMLGVVYGVGVGKSEPKLELRETIKVLGLAFGTFEYIEDSMKQLLLFAKVVAAARERAAEETLQEILDEVENGN